MADWRVDKHRYSREFESQRQYMDTKAISSRMPQLGSSLISNNNNNSSSSSSNNNAFASDRFTRKTTVVKGGRAGSGGRPSGAGGGAGKGGGPAVAVETPSGVAQKAIAGAPRRSGVSGAVVRAAGIGDSVSTGQIDLPLSLAAVRGAQSPRRERLSPSSSVASPLVRAGGGGSTRTRGGSYYAGDSSNERVPGFLRKTASAKGKIALVGKRASRDERDEGSTHTDTTAHAHTLSHTYTQLARAFFGTRAPGRLSIPFRIQPVFFAARRGAARRGGRRSPTNKEQNHGIINQINCPRKEHLLYSSS